MEEVGHKYNPLAEFGGGNNLPLSRKPMKDFWGQIPRRAELRNILLCGRRSHPPALTAGSGHDYGWWRWEPEGWNLGWLARVEEEASAKEEDESGTLYKDPKY